MTVEGDFDDDGCCRIMWSEKREKRKERGREGRREEAKGYDIFDDISVLRVAITS